MNYFKLCGDGFGRAIDCYPFTTEAERIAAFAAIMMAKEAVEHPVARHVRVVIWKRSPMHPELRIVGETPVEPGEAKPATECETDEELDMLYPPRSNLLPRGN
jgi:hypothetical protein